MSVDYDDVKEILSSKLTQPPTVSGYPYMPPMTLLYSIAAAELRAEKAEKACHVAEAALVRAQQQLLECHCHKEPYTPISVPSPVVLRQDHKEQQSESEERQAKKQDNNV
jgi:hypothetical protein